MISLFGTQIGFLMPSAFLAAGLAGAAMLFYAYLRKGKSKRIAVASTMFLKFLENIPRSRQKFLPPWRFFLEMLLLLLIAASIAGLYAENTADKIAVLLDNSASMQAVADNSALQEPLFNNALDKLKGELLSASWGSKFNIYVSSPVLTSLTGGYVSAAKARDRLENLKASNFKDNLQLGAEKIIQNKDFNKLIILSDKVPDTSVSNQANIDWRSLKTASDTTAYTNIALTGIRINNAGLNQEGSSLEAGLQVFSSKSSDFGNIEGKLRLSACKSFSDCRLPQLIEQREFSLRTNSTVNIAFNRLGENDFAYLIEIKDLRRGARSFNDAISVDNIAWVTSDSKKSKVLLVSELTAGNLGLEMIPTLDVTSLTPSQYESSKATFSEKDCNSIIFHRYVPEVLPDTNIIFVKPHDNKFFTVENDSRDVPVSRWKSGHELLSYLNLASLRFSLLSPFKIPNILEPLIYTPQGIAAFIGELKGKRMAAFGFEIFPYEGKRSPLLSVLTLNAFKWISEIASESGFQRIDYPYAITQDIRSVTSLNGKEYYRQNENLQVSRIYLDETTLVQINSDKALPAYQAVRFYNPEESNTSEIPAVKIINTDSKVPANKGIEDTYSYLLAAVALGLLLLDLLIQIFFLKKKSVQTARQAGGY